MSEKIICAAIWYKELPTPRYGYSNVETGIVFGGLRHVHCLYQMIAMTGKRASEVGKYEEGFITDTGRFVGRTEAGKIAIKAEQIDKLTYSQSMLFSEDLY